ncbi:dTMP kinase [Brachybacterium hainanense]|uniref:Thymidylate kinase n=1 Tax=Brachybacterium hainanense TaxID=1541174 RepID=A0ABV6RGC3_9MICO
MPISAKDLETLPVEPRGLEPVPRLKVPIPHAPRRGLFISFEGGDGAGKTTQISLLQQYLVAERTVDEDLVLVTREPGGTELGSRIRQLVLHGDHVDERAEALLYAADRAHHIATVVRPHLARGGLVLSDRYLDSSVAYQGTGRALDGEQITALNLWATSGLLPDRTILLDLPPESLGERREAGSLDRLEQEGLEFHEEVRRSFLELAEHEPERFVVIDGSLPREEIHSRVLAAIAPELARFDPTFEPVPPPRHRDEQ